MTDSGSTGRHEFGVNWPIVLVCFLGMMMGVMPTVVLGPLTKPLQAEFAWSQGQILTCFSFLGAGMMIGVLLVGALIDRVGATKVAVTSLLLMVVCFGIMTAVTGPFWQIQALYFVLGLFGAGANAITYTRAIGAHFRAARGMAMGIVLSGSGMAAFVAPLVLQAATSAAGWRGAVFGVVIVSVLVATVIALVRLERPAGTQTTASATSAGEPPLSGATRREAFRDIRFYLLMFSTAAYLFFAGSLMLSLIPMLISRGLTPAAAAAIASAYGISNFLGKLAAGWLLDRTNAAMLGAAVFGAAALGLATFVFGGTGFAIVATILFGFLTGSDLDLVSYMVMRYFGLREYGKIYSVISSIGFGVAIVGPLVCAVLIDSLGYDGLYNSAALAWLLGALSFVVLRGLEKKLGKKAEYDLGHARR